jgi:hypothetical protein
VSDGRAAARASGLASGLALAVRPAGLAEVSRGQRRAAGASRVAGCEAPVLILAAEITVCTTVIAWLITRARRPVPPPEPDGGHVITAASWREEASQDRLVRAQIGRDRDAVRAQLRTAERQALAEARRAEGRARGAARAQARKARTARRAVRAAWGTGAHGGPTPG